MGQTAACKKKTLRQFLKAENLNIDSKRYSREQNVSSDQRAKEVVSDSLGLVDFAIGLGDFCS